MSKGNEEYYKKLMTKPDSNDPDVLLNWLYNRGLVQNYIKKLEGTSVDPETLQDEIQEVWMFLIEKKDKLKEIYDAQGITGLTAYVSGVIARQIHSNSSVVYKKYKAIKKKLIHISNESWDVFDETGKMQDYNDDYSSTENENDILKKNIENNINE